MKTIQISFPIDSDGFLRRECPHCCREFKWLPDGPEAGEEDAVSYFCPYCRGEAKGDAWFTQAQLDHLNGAVREQAVNPLLDSFSRDLQRLNTRGGPIRFSSRRTRTAPPPPLSETDEMRRINPPCHPSEPIKIADDWGQPVHCLVCGSLVRP